MELDLIGFLLVKYSYIYNIALMQQCILRKTAETIYRVLRSPQRINACIRYKISNLY